MSREVVYDAGWRQGEGRRARRWSRVLGGSRVRVDEQEGGLGCWVAAG